MPTSSTLDSDGAVFLRNASPLIGEDLRTAGGPPQRFHRPEPVVQA